MARHATLFTESDKHTRVVATLFENGEYEISVDANSDDLFSALRQALQALHQERKVSAATAQHYERLLRVISERPVVVNNHFARMPTRVHSPL